MRACAICAPHLPLGPNPIVRLQASNRILIISQAPGTHAHAASRPFNDISGDRLRTWLGTPPEIFYGPYIGFMPMGLCYPGKGKTGKNPGDNPPRPECAPLWHNRLRSQLPNIKLTLLVGSYAQHFYLPEQRKLTLANRCHVWMEEQGPIIPMVHPSPRNLLWCKRNPWFESEMIPLIQAKIRQILSEPAKVQII